MIGSALLLIALTSATTIASLETPVTITITGLEASGKVFGQVFSSADSFKKREGAVHRFAIDPHGAKQLNTVVNLPPGRYAVALFQDTKGTGKMETNMFGSPIVPYGISNNARGVMGPPGFDAAAFDVSGTPTGLSIHLR